MAQLRMPRIPLADDTETGVADSASDPRGTLSRLIDGYALPIAVVLALLASAVIAGVVLVAVGHWIDH